LASPQRTYAKIIIPQFFIEEVLVADPVYYVLARERPLQPNENPNNVRLIRIGAAFQFRDGRDGFFVKLNARPFRNWDGSCMLLPPREANRQAPGDDDIPM
jgi:hypothetical protein